MSNLLPHPSISYSDLYNKYRSNYFLAFQDLFFHTFLLLSTYISLYYFRNIYFLSIPLTAILGLLHIKTFIIQHDCGHHSYTPNRLLNGILGTLLSGFSYLPYNWSYRHDTHHSTNGNIENKYQFNFNELVFYTFNEYKEMKHIKRTLLKLLFSPYILFSVLTWIKFIVVERFYVMKLIMKNYRYKPSIMQLILEQCFNNIIIILLNYIYYKHEIFTYVLLSTFLTTTIGALLFHNQHTYNPSYVVNDKQWNQPDSGLKGSSFIQIPWFFKYFTGGIEYHHIHHMNAKIPGYNLHKYHNEVISKSNLFDNITKLNMNDCYNNLWLKLYDEENKGYITFQEADMKINDCKNH